MTHPYRDTLTVVALLVAMALPHGSGYAQKKKIPVYGDHEITVGMGVWPIHASGADFDGFPGVPFYGYGYKVFEWATIALNYSYATEAGGSDGAANQMYSYQDRNWLGMVKIDLYFRRSEGVILYNSVGGGLSTEELPQQAPPKTTAAT